MSAENPRVAGIVLAAGEATRMGEPKVTLPYGGSTIVEAVVSVASAARLEPIIVVTGFYHEAVTAVIGDTATVVHNPDAASGNLSSLRVGVSAAGDVDAAVILLGDMPEIESETVQQLAHQVVSSGAVGGWVRYRGDQHDGDTRGGDDRGEDDRGEDDRGEDEMGHPMVLSRHGLAGFSALTGRRPVWRYLTSLDSDDVVVLDLDAPKPIDVNTPDDYRRLLAEQL
ncbi:MAG: nucleotidyltransferase family protein [Acidimicrobiia bacterium]|nr:nucleotidyltransferase family protein [Acidimicrobiia bacterium]